jgi:Cu(I)/Ag(I) efflux system membrane fusion protein
MKGLMSAAVVLSAALAAALGSGCAPDTANTPQSGSAMPASIVDPYVNIANALAKDSLDGVKANAGNIATASSALGAPAMKIDTSALQLASATEIGDAREKFGALSEAIVAYMDGLHLTLPDGVRVASCPMIHKPWLQRGSDIENPYFGSSMLTCGDFR